MYKKYHGTHIHTHTHAHTHAHTHHTHHTHMHTQSHTCTHITHTHMHTHTYTHTHTLMVGGLRLKVKLFDCNARLTTRIATDLGDSIFGYSGELENKRNYAHEFRELRQSAKKILAQLKKYAIKNFPLINKFIFWHNRSHPYMPYPSRLLVGSKS